MICTIMIIVNVYNNNPPVETDQNAPADDKEVIVATGPVTLVNPEAVVDTEEFQNQLKSDFAALDTDGSAVVTADEITLVQSHIIFSKNKIILAPIC